VVKTGEYPVERIEVKYLRNNTIYLVDEIRVKGILFLRKIIYTSSIPEYVQSIISGPGNKINPEKLAKSVKTNLPTYPGEFPKNEMHMATC